MTGNDKMDDGRDVSPVAAKSRGQQDRPVCIVGNGPFGIKAEGSFLMKTKGLSTIFNKGTLGRSKKNRNEASDDGGSSLRKFLAVGPPAPPVAPTAILKRASSSTLSLMTNKRNVLTLEDLYVEILYSILHMIGCDADKDEQMGLILHLKSAFHMEHDKHCQLLDTATMREEPYLKVNLEIVEARNLLGKDITGSSDPFCTFYLTTNPLARYNTSYKPKTLNPVWNEEFVLDVNSIENDYLRIDVWDFNPVEDVGDKLKKISEVRDSRGFRKLIKETFNASSKNPHDPLGSIEIPLSDIPSAGLEKWFPLVKPDGKSKKSRGEVKVNLTLSAEKDQNLTAQEHRHLLRILFSYELQKSQVEPFTWNGTFSRESVTILAQHAVQGKLTGADTALARWLVYAYTHCDLPLDYCVFVPILEKLRYALTNNLFHQDDETRFAEVAVVFVNHCLEFIKQHRHFVAENVKYYVQLESILRCLKMLHECLDGNGGREGRETTLTNKLKGGEADEELFPSLNSTIPDQMMDAMTQSILNNYLFIYNKAVNLAGDEEESASATASTKIKSLTNFVRVILSDLKEGCEASDKIFTEEFQLSYSQKAYHIYGEKLTELIKEPAETHSASLKQVKFDEIGVGDEDEQSQKTLIVGTALFELYLALQSYVQFGKQFETAAAATAATTASEVSNEMSENHLWFDMAVARWLDIALYKAMLRIIRAVELDALEPVDSLVTHSSSAVDLRTVLIQIKTFWKELKWPDVEGSYALISKILDDICKTCIFYVDQMCEKVESSSAKDGSDTKYVVTPQLCLAVNNIDYILQFIDPFVEELGTEETVDRLEILKGSDVSDKCRKTLKTLVCNTKENIENKILEILDNVGEKMAPVIQRFLLEGSSRMTYAGSTTETLVNYLDNNLLVLKKELNDTNFGKILSVIWESSAQTLYDTIQYSIERKKPPNYFSNLLQTLKVLINFFYGDKIPQDETLLKMRSLLQLYASDSSELIERYLWERYKDQKAVPPGEYSLGSITVRCQLLRDHLRVEVLNARHLKPPDPLSARIRENNMKLLNGRKRRAFNTQNMSRSQRNLKWVKSKFLSIRSNLHDASVHFHTATNAGQCDPYVSLRLVPASRFKDCPKQNTRVHKRTLFPLFDETFDFVIRNRSHHFHDSYILLTVKDRSLISGGIFLGEAMLPLDEIPESDINQDLSEAPQIQLPVTKPTTHQGSDIMLALNSRSFDPVANEFLKKEKRKL